MPFLERNSKVRELFALEGIMDKKKSVHKIPHSVLRWVLTLKISNSKKNMFLTAEFMYELRVILGFFLRNHSPRRYFQKTVFVQFSYYVRYLKLL